MVGCGPGPPEAWAALPFARAGAAAELPGAPGAASAAEGAATNAPVTHPSAGALATGGAAAFPFAAGLARGCEPAFPFPVGFAAAFPFGAMAYDTVRRAVVMLRRLREDKNTKK